MKRQLKPTLSIQDYEQAADTFIRLLFEFTEQHIMVSAQKKPLNPTLRCLQNAALSVDTSIKCFIALARMNNQ